MAFHWAVKSQGPGTTGNHGSIWRWISSRPPDPGKCVQPGVESDLKHRGLLICGPLSGGLVLSLRPHDLGFSQLCRAPLRNRYLGYNRANVEVSPTVEWLHETSPSMEHRASYSNSEICGIMWKTASEAGGEGLPTCSLDISAQLLAAASPRQPAHLAISHLEPAFPPGLALGLQNHCLLTP